MPKYYKFKHLDFTRVNELIFFFDSLQKLYKINSFQFYILNQIYFDHNNNITTKQFTKIHKDINFIQTLYAIRKLKQMNYITSNKRRSKLKLTEAGINIFLYFQFKTGINKTM